MNGSNWLNGMYMEGKDMVLKNCQYCGAKTNDFISLNQTVDYSNIEISINYKGILRARVFDIHGDLISQDVVEIKFCPFCGKPFKKF